MNNLDFNFIIKITIFSLFLYTISFFYLNKWIFISKFFLITSYPTKRGLHKNPISTSGGTVFSIYLLVVLFFEYLGTIDQVFFLLIILGGALTLIYGVLDDKYILSAKKKIIVQSILAILILITNQTGFFSYLFNQGVYLDFIISYLFIVTIFNSCNFIDGADGTLLFFKLYILTVFIIISLIKNFFLNELLFILFLIPFLISLLYFNISRKMFIGESGSFFISFFVIIVFIFSINNNILNLGHWLLIGSYFIWDVSITVILRLFKKNSFFFDAHKDHAYQNFVFLKKKHQLFNLILMTFKIFFVTPIIFFYEYNYINIYYSFTFVSFPIICFIINYSPIIRQPTNENK